MPQTRAETLASTATERMLEATSEPLSLPLKAKTLNPQSQPQPHQATPDRGPEAEQDPDVMTANVCSGALETAMIAGLREVAMKLMSWNVNGIRAASNKGFRDWFSESGADVVCLQEIKCRPEQLDESLVRPEGYFSFWHPAEKPGYSGLVTYSKREPLAVRAGIGVPSFDCEGRILELEFESCLVINTYFPNSQRDHARLSYKLEFCEAIFERLEDFRRAGKNVLICGDFNIAHKEIDLKNPKSNTKNAGFLPEERDWMDRFTEAGWIDAFRKFEEGPGHYTWWSQRPGCRAKNIGWRLDYVFVNPEAAGRLSRAWHEPHVTGSDHCPVGAEIRF